MALRVGRRLQTLEDALPVAGQTGTPSTTTTTGSAESSSCSCACNTTSCSSRTVDAQEHAQGQGLQERVPVELRVLTMSFPGSDHLSMRRIASEYYNLTNGAVKVTVDTVDAFWAVYDEMRVTAENKLTLYDGFLSGSGIIGTAAQHNALMDLTSIVREKEALEWTDVLMGFREHVAVYDHKVLMLPADGDAHYLYYRKDILDTFQLPVPRTWEEYWQVAKAVHGKMWKSKKLVGSCVGRNPDRGYNLYWENTVLASYTQTNGRAHGFLFDPEDMTPLTGEAMAEMIHMMEQQVRYGHPDEFLYGGGSDRDAVNINAMNNGECVLTYNWGDSFVRQYQTDPPSQAAGLVDVAVTPGATKVYNRVTKKLESCTEVNCGGPGGQYYPDIGWVNRAPYLAFGGWSASVNNFVSDNQKQHMTDFFVHMVSPKVSLGAIIKNSTTDPEDSNNGADPFRASHLNIQAWVDKGYDKGVVETYTKAIKDSVNSPNHATDVRFASADVIGTTMEREIYPYLVAARNQTLPDSAEDRHKMRMDISNRITQKWIDIIATENARPQTVIPVLEQYQRDLGIYQRNINYHQLGPVRAIGYVMASIIIAASLGAAIWVYVRRNNFVVRASQPLFLVILCFGTFVMGSAIFPLGMDDGFFGYERGTNSCPGCDVACTVSPWLVFSGFSIIFAALFSKLWRINLMLNRLQSGTTGGQKRVKIQAKDVMLPFVALFSLNLILLTLWTALDPLRWERVLRDELNSYGMCRAEKGTPAIVLAVLLAVVNISALAFAQVQAYKVRAVSDQLSESKYIGLATSGIMQVFIIAVPLLAVDRDNESPSKLFFLVTSIIFVICMAMLLLIFVPKFIFVQRNILMKNKRKSSSLFKDLPKLSGLLRDSKKSLKNTPPTHRVAANIVNSGIQVEEESSDCDTSRNGDREANHETHSGDMQPSIPLRRDTECPCKVDDIPSIPLRRISQADEVPSIPRRLISQADDVPSIPLRRITEYQADDENDENSDPSSNGGSGLIITASPALAEAKIESLQTLLKEHRRRDQQLVEVIRQLKNENERLLRLQESTLESEVSGLSY